MASLEEANLVSCPDKFRVWIEAALKEKKYVAALDQLNLDVKNSDLYYEACNARIPVRSILKRDWEIVPNTEASRILYGNK